MDDGYRNCSSDGCNGWTGDFLKDPAKKSFNDRMVSKTVLPVIYLWMAAAGAVVAMGIYQPDIVLMNLDGFIALIAIIGGVAAPAFNTLLRMWEQEQTAEGNEIPNEYIHQRAIETLGAEHERGEDAKEHEHQMYMEKELKIPWREEPPEEEDKKSKRKGK